jgi:hypothetical protein
MASPPSGTPPPPQPYSGMYYAPMPVSNMLTRRTVFALNAIGLLFMWIGFLIALTASPTDTGLRSLDS